MDLIKKNWGFLAYATICLVIGVVLIVALCMIAGFLTRIPGVDVAVGFLWFLPLAAGFVMAVAMLGLALGWPLMYSATSAGAKAASSHTGALAGNDRVYDDILRNAGVIRAYALRDLLEYARALPALPTPKGENVVIITGAGGSGVLLSDACVDNGLELMKMPDDLDAAFRKFIPPFGAAGNPVDITGGEPPTTYRNTVALALEDERIHSIILGYWHTIITPPMVFANLVVDVVEEMKAKGIPKG